MLIKLLDQQRVRVHLNEQDMQRFGLSSQALFCTASLSPDETALYTGRILGKPLCRLLDAVSSQTGFDYDGKKLFIEAYASAQGGCVLLFTALREARTRYRIKTDSLSPYLFAFEGPDALFAGARAVFCSLSHRVLCSSLYYTRAGIFVLSLRPLDAPQSLAVQLMREFGRIVGRGAATEAVVREHAKALREGDAIEVLSRYG